MKIRISNLLSTSTAIVVVVSGMMGTGCGELSPYVPTPVPTMIPYVDDPFAQSGIRATPGAIGSDTTDVGGILVEWNKIDPAVITGVRLGGYYVYRARTSSEIEPRHFIRIQKKGLADTGDDTTYVDTDITAGYIYSYYVTSYNRSDESQESGPSDTVQFQPTIRPILEEPQGDVARSTNGPFQFYFGPKNQLGGLMAIEVNEVDPNYEKRLIRRVWRSDSEYVDYANPRIDYRGDSLIGGHRYRWRVVKFIPLINVPDQLPLPQGNTSQWKTFTVKP